MSERGYLSIGEVLTLLQEEFPHVPEARVAEATAHWVAGEARTELLLRELNSDWIDGAIAELRAPQRALVPA